MKIGNNTGNDYCVYMHKCLINGKVYIGQTNNAERRWRNKGIEYKPKKDNTRPFWNAIVKYGWDNFEHIIIENNLTKEQANEREKYYILKYNSRNKQYGYNVAEGGDGGIIYKQHPKGMLGKHHDKEWSKKHSEDIKKASERGAYKDLWKNKEHPKGMLGKHHSEENRKTMTLKAIETCKKKLLIIMPNGEKIIANSRKECMEILKITNSIVDRLRKTKEPYKVSKNTAHNREYLLTLEGLIILDYKEELAQ